jgi:hypothetical protein
MTNGVAPTTRIEQFNQAVRSVVTLAFAAGILYGFTVSKLISAEVFVPMAGGVITWWFVRDQASATSKEATEMIKTPPPVAAPAPEVKP